MARGYNSSYSSNTYYGGAGRSAMGANSSLSGTDGFSRTGGLGSSSRTQNSGFASGQFSARSERAGRNSTAASYMDDLDADADDAEDDGAYGSGYTGMTNDASGYSSNGRTASSGRGYNGRSGSAYSSGAGYSSGGNLRDGYASARDGGYDSFAATSGGRGSTGRGSSNRNGVLDDSYYDSNGTYASDNYDSRDGYGSTSDDYYSRKAGGSARATRSRSVGRSTSRSRYDRDYNDMADEGDDAVANDDTYEAYGRDGYNQGSDGRYLTAGRDLRRSRSADARDGGLSSGRGYNDDDYYSGANSRVDDTYNSRQADYDAGSTRRQTLAPGRSTGYGGRGGRQTGGWY